MNTSLQKALQDMINNYGHSVLNDSNKIIGTIADFVPNNLKERKMINIVIYENIPSKLLCVKDENITIKEITINRCIKQLEDEYGMKTDVAEKIINYFVIALNYGIMKNGVLCELSKKYSIKSDYNDITIEECIKLGEEDNLKVQLYLGKQYLNGIRVKKDIKKAIYWFEKASKQNDLVALCNLAILRLQEKRSKMEGKF